MECFKHAKWLLKHHQFWSLKLCNLWNLFPIFFIIQIIVYSLWFFKFSKLIFYALLTPLLAMFIMFAPSRNFPTLSSHVFLFKSCLNLHISNIDNNLKVILCLIDVMDLLSFVAPLINMTQFSFSTSIWIKRWLVITLTGCKFYPLQQIISF